MSARGRLILFTWHTLRIVWIRFQVWREENNQSTLVSDLTICIPAPLWHRWHGRSIQLKFMMVHCRPLHGGWKRLLRVEIRDRSLRVYNKVITGLLQRLPPSWICDNLRPIQELPHFAVQMWRQSMFFLYLELLTMSKACYVCFDRANQIRGCQS